MCWWNVLLKSWVLQLPQLQIVQEGDFDKHSGGRSLIMDPNEALRDLMEVIANASTKTHKSACVEHVLRGEVLDRLDNLTIWLEKGGFMPKVVRHASRGATNDTTYGVG